MKEVSGWKDDADADEGEDEDEDEEDESRSKRRASLENDKNKRFSSCQPSVSSNHSKPAPPPRLPKTLLPRPTPLLQPLIFSCARYKLQFVRF